MRIWLPTIVLLIATACGGVTSPEGAADWVDGDEVALLCGESGQPIRVQVPRDAVVQTYLCDADGRRCATIGHVLADDVVEVPCTTSTARPRHVRWVAPIR